MKSDITSSAHNPTFDGTKAQVRIRLNTAHENRPVEDADTSAEGEVAKDKWRNVAFWWNKAGIMNDTEPIDKIASGLCTHATLWLCLQEAGPSDIMSQIEPSVSTARQVENVRQVLSLLRPLSVS